MDMTAHVNPHCYAYLNLQHEIVIVTERGRPADPSDNNFFIAQIDMHGTII
jgi:hypothetical protein